MGIVAMIILMSSLAPMLSSGGACMARRATWESNMDFALGICGSLATSSVGIVAITPLVTCGGLLEFNQYSVVSLSEALLAVSAPSLSLLCVVNDGVSGVATSVTSSLSDEYEASSKIVLVINNKNSLIIPCDRITCNMLYQWVWGYCTRCEAHYLSDAKKMEWRDFQ